MLVDESTESVEPGQYICECLEDINLIIGALSQLVEVGIRNDEVVPYVTEGSAS